MPERYRGDVTLSRAQELMCMILGFCKDGKFYRSGRISRKADPRVAWAITTLKVCWIESNYNHNTTLHKDFIATISTLSTNTLASLEIKSSNQHGRPRSAGIRHR